MNPFLRRPLLAALPVLGFALEAKSAFLYGAVVGLTLLIATLIFLLIQALLPVLIYRVSFLVLVLAIGVLAGHFLAVPAVALASLVLLIPPEFLRRRKNWDPMARKLILGGLTFWALLTGHGVVSEQLGLPMGWEFFRLPVGSYLLVGFLPLLWRGR